jgi:hypothetical protein
MQKAGLSRHGGIEVFQPRAGASSPGTGTRAPAFRPSGGDSHPGGWGRLPNRNETVWRRPVGPSGHGTPAQLLHPPARAQRPRPTDAPPGSRARCSACSNGSTKVSAGPPTRREPTGSATRREAAAGQGSRRLDRRRRGRGTGAIARVKAVMPTQGGGRSTLG